MNHNKALQKEQKQEKMQQQKIHHISQLANASINSTCLFLKNIIDPNTLL